MICFMEGNKIGGWNITKKTLKSVTLPKDHPNGPIVVCHPWTYFFSIAVCISSCGPMGHSSAVWMVYISMWIVWTSLTSTGTFFVSWTCIFTGILTFWHWRFTWSVVLHTVPWILLLLPWWSTFLCRLINGPRSSTACIFWYHWLIISTFTSMWTI